MKTDFSRCNTNFGPGIDVHTAVGLTRQARSDSVDNTNAEGTTLQTVPKRQDRVGGLSTLAHKHTDIIPENGCFPIQEVRCQLDADRYLRKFLKDRSCRQAGVIA